MKDYPIVTTCSRCGGEIPPDSAANVPVCDKCKDEIYRDCEKEQQQ